MNLITLSSLRRRRKAVADRKLPNPSNRAHSSIKKREKKVWMVLRLVNKFFKLSLILYFITIYTFSIKV